MDLRSTYRNLKAESVNAGWRRAFTHLLYRYLNKLINLRRFEVLALQRENLTPIDPAKYANVYSRLATEEDLNQMTSEGKWQMTEELKEAFQEGDKCLLSFVDGKLAGYTWIHTAGRPRLIPGLSISIPENFGYNYAGFTLPEFRGIGLQPYRHHEVLNRPEWHEKNGIIGYVECTNWNSKKGLSKSGYRKLGDMTLIGRNDRLKVTFSNELKTLGIKRIAECLKT